ncbi:MAG: glycosyl transferase family protein [Acidobacteria bacterium]|nr:glycosyl transferase family protein [Acidobacteriota bacterium]
MYWTESLPYVLLPLVVWLTISGLDDLFLLGFWIYFRIREGGVPPEAVRGDGVERNIAIFTPLWQEEAVVRQMVTHNVTAIQYTRYHFFIGAYPNDEPTIDAIRELPARFANVHLALVPHDGPTSKADCLNWIYQQMLLEEEQSGEQFDAIITHDAEDLIHPNSLRAVNAHLPHYDMIQVPVLPLATSVREWVHGVYIDEFSEFQSRDLYVRARLGGFLPSAGVGTAFSRRALERLAVSAENRIFEPSCLTEDYESGFRVRSLGFRQILLPAGRDVVATREYFPRTWQAATKQRTRWVSGIVWQGIERHGWQGGWRQWWWHWRDRKGLVGNPMSLLANVLLFIGLFVKFDHAMPAVVPFTLGMAVLQAAARAAIVYRYYGWRHALLAPLRIPLANAINAVAAGRATWRYWRARWRGEPLVWLKTAHQYPNRAALEAHRPTLQEVLVQSGYCTCEQVEAAIRSKPAGKRLADWIVACGAVSEGQMYEALSLQLCVPLASVHPWEIPAATARALPAHVVRETGVIPIRRQAGELVLASADLPAETVQKNLQEYTRMPVRFALVTRSNYAELRGALLPGEGAA